jgi:Zn-finger nucleic acid-binding protein
MLESMLSAQTCHHCHGLFIASTDYWAWLEYHPTVISLDASYKDACEVNDSVRAKRCPGCGYLQLSYDIALDLTFGLDQCGHCNSFWLDRGEWAELRARGLHAKLHKITGEAWQRMLRKERSRLAQAAIYTEKFGVEGYAEARRIRAWLRAHPAHQMLRAYLLHDDEEV